MWIKRFFKEKLNNLEKNLAQVVNFLDENFIFTSILGFVLALYYRLATTDFSSILIAEFYLYVVKAMEIVKGDFSPILTHSNGWPIFLAPFFYILKPDNVFTAMNYAKVISDVVGSLILVPLVLVIRSLTKNIYILIIAMALFVFYPALVESSNSAVNENLFILLFLLFIYFLMRAMSSKINIYGATVMAAFSFYVRPNGLFLLGIIFIFYFFIREKKISRDFTRLFFVGVIFFLVALPFLYQRYEYFGSAFTYGSNDKIFVDNFLQIWAENVPTPSFIQYLSTHNPIDYITRFLFDGVLKVIFTFILESSSRFVKHAALSPILLIFFIYGFLKYGFNKKFIPLVLSFIMFILGLSVVFALFYDIRHLYPLIPIIIVFSSFGIYDIFKDNNKKHLLLFLVLSVFVVFSVSVLINNQEKYYLPQWAVWSAENLKGKIAVSSIAADGELIMMNLPDTKAGTYGLSNLNAPMSGISLINQGYFFDLKTAISWLKEQGTEYILINEKNFKMSPYIYQLYDNNISGEYVEEVYSNFDFEPSWKVRIFKIK